MTVDELRKEIIDQHNIDPRIVEQTKGKAKLNNLLQSLNKNNGNNENNITVLDFDVDFDNDSETEKDKPKKSDPDWTNYILSQLTSDEKDDKLKYPKTDGLRRLVEKEIDKILSITTEVIQAPNIENGMVATVISTLVLHNGDIYSAVADAKRLDLIPPYDKHVSAIAETRAEGRCYRKTLRLKNVITKEEAPHMDHTPADSGLINDTQIQMIDRLCSNDRLNINIRKYLKNKFKENYKENIQSYFYEEGQKICGELSEYQTDVNNIDKELLGFDVNWRS